MGSCTSKDKVASPYRPNSNQQNFKKPPPNQSSKRAQQIYGIIRNSQSQSLKFNHSPLRNCPFLFQKFKQSDGTPQELNLGFMVTKCTISTQPPSLLLSYINTTPLKIWLIYGGHQRVTQTGLTLQITNIKQIESISVPSPPDSSNQQGSRLIGLKQRPTENVLIVLEPSVEGQTLFMVYRYQKVGGQKEYAMVAQGLQWSSLAFRIEDIYGAEHLFKCNNQNQVCSICLTNKSECILLPCRHMCLCPVCHQQVEKTKPLCPLCRKQYYSVVKYRNN